MSKTAAFFLSVTLSVLIGMAIPLCVDLWRPILAKITGMGISAYSVMVACVAAPLLYAIFRQMR